MYASAIIFLHVHVYKILMQHITTIFDQSGLIGEAEVGWEQATINSQGMKNYPAS